MRKKISFEFHNALKKQRKFLKMSLEDVSVALGISKSRARQYETSTSFPREATVKKLAILLKFDNPKLWMKMIERDKKKAAQLDEVISNSSQCLLLTQIKKHKSCKSK